jgi:hypothetical protein
MKILKAYQEGWGTIVYFIGFFILLNIFAGIPLKILFSALDGYGLALYIVIGAFLLIYFPFAMLWASRLSGVKPLTPKEAEGKRRKEIEEYRKIKKNIEPGVSEDG